MIIRTLKKKTDDLSILFFLFPMGTFFPQSFILCCLDNGPPDLCMTSWSFWDHFVFQSHVGSLVYWIFIEICFTFFAKHIHYQKLPGEWWMRGKDFEALQV